ncbi:polymorphic toxin-type HINT domain-containing protein, partial [Amycolatopsis samaneae]
AAREARDAADSAAAHARAAAQAADDAAQAAWEADQAARLSQEAADAATESAKQAQDAVDAATRIAETSRKADTERLAEQQAAAIAAAQDAKQVEADKQAKAEWEAGQAAKLDAEVQRLLTEARDPATPKEKVVANGRKAAMRLARTGGPWAKAAAEAALIGGETDVRIYVTTDQLAAVERDDRASVSAIADTTPKIAQRQAAITALAGDTGQIKEFLRTRAYTGEFDDLLGQVREIMLAAKPGSNVRTEASKAIDTNTVEALREFVTVRQHQARTEDNRNEFRDVMACAAACPEVNAVAQAALEGPDSQLRRILDVEVPKARQRDADTAVHVAEIDGYLANASQSAATARVNAAQAQEAAAQARQAAEDAARYHDEAVRQAGLAKDYAKQAKESADRAQASADQAAASAKVARDAAAAANRAAESAARSVEQAVISAQKANDYANDARASAEKARAEAIAAGKSAAEAAADAAAAAKAAADKKLAEDQQRRATDEQRRQDQVNNPGGIGQPGTGVDDDHEVLPAGDDDVLRLDGGQQQVDEYHGAQRDANKSVIDWVVENGGQVILDIIGYTDAKKCFTEGDIVSCIFTALNAIGPLKAIAVAFKLPKAFAVAVKLVTGFGRFREVTAAARTLFERVGARLRDVFSRLRNPCSPNSFTPDTPVLMADGTHKAIRDVRIGDQVRARDPLSGRAGPRPVTNLITGEGVKNLVAVTVDGGGHTGTLQATDGHPFWVGDHQWRDAKDLKVGDRLYEPDGHWATVTATHHWTATQRVHNLTVDDLHTFYVLAADVAVLVHNSSGGAKICQLGQAGEAAVAKATGRSHYSGPAIRVNGRDRLPDFYDRANPFIGEAKNVAYQYLSTQLKDYMDLAGQLGVKLVLYVRAGGGTRLSKPLEDLRNQGKIIIQDII